MNLISFDNITAYKYISPSNVSDLEIDFIPINVLFEATSEIIENTINDILANNFAISLDSYKTVNKNIFIRGASQKSENGSWDVSL